MSDEKICNFYANEVHLGVTIIPFVANAIKENRKICTLLNTNMNNEVQNIVSKINIDDRLKSEILNINWKKSENNKEDIKNYVESEIKNYSDVYVIINGNKDEVEKKNKYIEEIKKENKNRNKNINIVNCFQIDKVNVNEGFLENYNKILNSSGCKYIQN